MGQGAEGRNLTHQEKRTKDADDTHVNQPSDPRTRGDDSGEEPTKELESLRRKLRARRQRRSTSESPPSSGAIPSIVYQRSLPRTGPPTSTYRPPSGCPLTLAEAVSGWELAAPSGPPYYRADRALASLHPKLAAYCRDEFRAFLTGSRSDSDRLPLVRTLLDLCNGTMPSPRNLLVLDVETTGLSSSPVFLIGMLIAEGEGFVIRQFLARTYAEERSIISAYAQAASGKSLFVTFNGKSFDIPYLRARAAAVGTSVPEPVAHLDLLHTARKVYSEALPDCRLQTLERYVCRRHRVGDILGEHIPDAYHHFVRTGNAVEVARIVKHNAQDLVTLLELLVRMLCANELTG